MKYMGSKRRIRNELIQVISKRSSMNKPWVEPFIGGANMIEVVKSGERFGSDVDPCIIRALKFIRDSPNAIPLSKSDFSEDAYREIRLKRKDELTDLECYAGYAFSYGGKWLGGWCRDSAGKRDYVAEAYRNAIKQHKSIQGVNLRCCDYTDVNISRPSIIYCDPPYRGTTKYNNTFDYDRFYAWCVEKHRLGHDVYISEYNMPSGFKCLWSREIVSSLTKDTGAKKGTESLFIVEV